MDNKLNITKDTTLYVVSLYKEFIGLYLDYDYARAKYDSEYSIEATNINTSKAEDYSEILIDFDENTMVSVYEGFIKKEWNQTIDFIYKLSKKFNEKFNNNKLKVICNSFTYQGETSYDCMVVYLGNEKDKYYNSKEFNTLESTIIKFMDTIA